MKSIYYMQAILCKHTTCTSRLECGQHLSFWKDIILIHDEQILQPNFWDSIIFWDTITLQEKIRRIKKQLISEVQKNLFEINFPAL